MQVKQCGSQTSLTHVKSPEYFSEANLKENTQKFLIEYSPCILIFTSSYLHVLFKMFKTLRVLAKFFLSALVLYPGGCATFKVEPMDRHPKSGNFGSKGNILKLKYNVDRLKKLILQIKHICSISKYMLQKMFLQKIYFKESITIL